MLKSVFAKSIAICLAVIMLAAGLPLDALAEYEAVESGISDTASSTVAAPDDYSGGNTFLTKPGTLLAAQADEAGKKVLLIEDRDPWNSTANQIILSRLTEYKKVTTEGFLNEDLSEYAVIIFANDQPFATYENYTKFKDQLELFASIGGVIVFGACDAGWADGVLNAPIPGNVTKTNHYEYYNYIADPKHPIVTGELTSNDTLTDADLVSYYCSHISFDEETLPPGSRVILRESSTNRPTLVEYPLGKGRVIASGLTWEHNYRYHGQYISGILAGDFSKAIDDIFAYAIRISNIDVEELHLLKELHIRKTAHSIIVADKSSQDSAFSPIAGAAVAIDGTEYTTDENGQVLYAENYGEHTVHVSADGYRQRSMTYNLQPRTSYIFLLEKEKEDGLPYLVEVRGKLYKDGINLDLRDHAISLTENKSDLVEIFVQGNWNGHEEGFYEIYQDPTYQSPGKKLITRSGRLVFTPATYFKPDRPVKVRMVSDDGTKSEAVTTKLKVYKDMRLQIQAPPENIEYIKPGISKMDWFGSHPVESDSDIFTKLLTTDMSISSELIPVEITSEHNDDGTITYRAAIGFLSGEGVKNILHSKKDEEKFKPESAWETFKKEIKNYKKAGNPKSYFERLKKKYGRDWHATKLRATIETEVDVCGFFEITVDRYGRIAESDGGIVVNAGADGVIGRTFMAGPVPVYYEIKPGIGLEFEGGVEFYSTENGLGFRPKYPSITLELPRISIEGGVGVRNVATVGVQGNGKLEIEYNMAGNETSGTLELGGAIHVKVIFVVDYKWDFWNTSIALWPKNRMRAFALNDLSLENAELSLVSRDYLKNITRWNGNAGGRGVLLNAADSPVIKTLQEGVMPDAMPQIQKVGDKLIMLFLRDVPERAVGNHTQLVYSVYEDGAWSEPVPVWETDTADFFLKSVVADGTLHVAWQKLKRVPSEDTPDELLNEVCANTEICYAEWDPESGSFVNQQYITDNDRLDMYPAVAAGNGAVSVVWVTNSDNNPIGTGGSYTVRSANITDGSAGDTVDLYETTQAMTELAAGYTDSGLNVMFAALEQDPDKSNLYILNDDSAVSVPSGNESTSLQFENGVFMWHSDGVIYQLVPGTGAPAEIVPGAVVSSSYKYVADGENAAIVWTDTQTDEDGKQYSVLKAVIPANGTWSEPVVLLDNLPNVSFMDVEMLEDGQFAIAANTVTFDDGEENEKTSLIFALVPRKCDVEVLSAIAEEPDYDNNIQAVDIAVRNNGSIPAESVHLTISDGSTLYADKTLDVNLEPGQEAWITENIDISALDQVKTFDVEVSAENDSDTANNTTQITLGHVDVSLALDAYDLGDKIVFALQTSNDSNTLAHCAISIIEDKADGIVLDVKNIGEVSNEDNVLYLYEIDKEKIEFDEANLKTYFFRVDTLEADWNTEDNQIVYVVSGNPDESMIDENGPMEEAEVIPAVSVNISADRLEFESPESDSVKLSVVLEPADTSFTDVLWSVEDPDVAHVNEEGIVTPLRPGTTVLTARVTDEVFDTIPIIVRANDEHYLTVAAGEGGRITAGESGLYRSGDKINLAAAASDGYRFVKWTSSAGGSFENENSPQTTFTMPQNDTTVTAVFTKTGESTPSGSTPAVVPQTGGTDEASVSVAELNRQISQNSYAVINVRNGKIILGKAALDSLALKETDTLSLSVKPVNKDFEGKRVLYDIALKCGDKYISSFGGNNVIIGLKYDNEPDEDVNCLAGIYLSSNGNTDLIELSSFDEKNGYMMMITDHLSLFGVLYKPEGFTDADGHWGEDYIQFASSHGIINGIAAGRYDPDRAVTRAEFAKMLASLANADLGRYRKSRFTDVPDGAWYMAYVEWAAEMGIVKGIGSNMFAPGEEISREQMAVMIDNFVKVYGYALPAVNDANEFSDQAEISSWSADAVTMMAKAGIITGKPGNIFAPHANASRAEAAAVITRLITILVNQYQA